MINSKKLEELKAFREANKLYRVKARGGSSSSNYRFFLSGKDKYHESYLLLSSGYNNIYVPHPKINLSSLKHNSNNADKNKSIVIPAHNNVPLKLTKPQKTIILKFCKGARNIYENDLLVNYIFKQENIIYDQDGIAFTKQEEIDFLLKNKNDIYGMVDSDNYYDINKSGKNLEKSKQFNKHIIFSFPCDTAEDFNDIINKSMKETFGENVKFIYAVHKDSKNVHAHVLLDLIDNDKLVYRPLNCSKDKKKNDLFKLKKSFFINLKSKGYRPTYKNIENEVDQYKIVDKTKQHRSLKKLFENKVLVVDFGRCIHKYSDSNKEVESFYVTYYKDNEIKRIQHRDLEKLFKDKNICIGDFVNFKYSKEEKSFIINEHVKSVFNSEVIYDKLNNNSSLMKKLNSEISSFQDSLFLKLEKSEYINIYSELFFDSEFHLKNKVFQNYLKEHKLEYKSSFELECIRSQFMLLTKANLYCKNKELAFHVIHLAKLFKFYDEKKSQQDLPIENYILEVLSLNKKFKVKNFESYLKEIYTRIENKTFNIDSLRQTTNKVINKPDKSKEEFFR